MRLFTFAMLRIIFVLLTATAGSGRLHAASGNITVPATNNGPVLPNKKYDECLRDKSKSDKLTPAILKVCGKYLPSKQAGGLTAGEILAVIRFNLNGIRKCYEAALKRVPDLKGKLRVRFVIDLTGKVKSVEPTTNEEDLKEKEMIECVRTTVSGWRFQRPRGKQDVTVNYPFVFNSL